MLSILVNLNQYLGESFFNRSTIQITKLTVTLFNFTKNFLFYIILIENVSFLTLLEHFSSCNILYLGNFMTHLFYFSLLTSFLANFSGNFEVVMLCGDIELNPGPRHNSSQSFSICHWNLNGINGP